MGEKVTIVGYHDVDFTDDSGRAVSGRSYFYIADSDGVNGQLAGKMFVSTKALGEMAFTPQPGDDVVVYYNRYGKPSSFELV